MARATTLLLVLSLLLLPAPPAWTQEVTNPIRHTWIATTATDWLQALNALLLSNGDGSVFLVPTSDEERRWVILRQVQQGSIYIPEEEPHWCDAYRDAASARMGFAATESCRRPMFIVAPDGQSLVLSLRACDADRRRVVRQ